MRRCRVAAAKSSMGARAAPVSGPTRATMIQAQFMKATATAKQKASTSGSNGSTKRQRTHKVAGEEEKADAGSSAQAQTPELGELWHQCAEEVAAAANTPERMRNTGNPRWIRPSGPTHRASARLAQPTRPARAPPPDPATPPPSPWPRQPHIHGVRLLSEPTGGVNRSGSKVGTSRKRESKPSGSLTCVDAIEPLELPSGVGKARPQSCQESQAE